MIPIAIFGAPRSGTTWLGQIFNSSVNTLYRYQPLFSYEFKNRLDENSSKHDINKFHSDLINSKSNFVLTNLEFKIYASYLDLSLELLQMKNVYLPGLLKLFLIPSAILNPLSFNFHIPSNGPSFEKAPELSLTIASIEAFASTSLISILGQLGYVFGVLAGDGPGATQEKKFNKYSTQLFIKRI